MSTQEAAVMGATIGVGINVAQKVWNGIRIGPLFII